MNEMTKTRMLLTTAVFAAAAALMAGPANAFLDEGGAGGGTSAVAAAPAGEPGTIPYLSHGIGVDESLFQGQAQAPPSLGLTGDSAATRYAEPQSIVTVTASSGDDSDWTWVGIGAGMAALVAAGLAGVLLSARHRGRVALP